MIRPFGDTPLTPPPPLLNMQTLTRITDTDACRTATADENCCLFSSSSHSTTLLIVPSLKKLTQINRCMQDRNRSRRLCHFNLSPALIRPPSHSPPHKIANPHTSDCTPYIQDRNLSSRKLCFFLPPFIQPPTPSLKLQTLIQVTSLHMIHTGPQQQQRKVVCPLPPLFLPAPSSPSTALTSCATTYH